MMEDRSKPLELERALALAREALEPSAEAKARVRARVGSPLAPRLFDRMSLPVKNANRTKSGSYFQTLCRSVSSSRAVS